MARPRREHDPYDLLPEAIRGQITRGQFDWLSDEAKAGIVADMTTPDQLEDAAE